MDAVGMESAIKNKIMDLSNCEKRVLACIYEYERKYGKAPDLPAIMQISGEKYQIEWKGQTVCTFLKRIEKKGFIEIEKMGKGSLYHSKIPFDEYLRREFEEVCRLYFSDDLKQLKKYIRGLN